MNFYKVSRFWPLVICYLLQITYTIESDGSVVVDTIQINDNNNDISLVNNVDINDDFKAGYGCYFGQGFPPELPDLECGIIPDIEMCGEGYMCVTRFLPRGTLCCSAGSGSCHREQQIPDRALEPDVFIPNCHFDGSYKPLQCLPESCLCSTPDRTFLSLIYFLADEDQPTDEVCEDLLSIYEHVCIAETDLRAFLKELVALYKTAAEKLKAQEDSSDQSGRDALQDLFDLRQCLQELLATIVKLKEDIHLGKLEDFETVQAELEGILETLAEKVTKMKEIMGRLAGLGLLRGEGEEPSVGVDSLDDIQDALLEALLAAAKMILNDVTEDKDEPVEGLPRQVPNMCGDVDRLLGICVDLIAKYQEIRQKLKEETTADDYPYLQMNNLLTCIADFCYAIRRLHLYLVRIKSGELNPKAEGIITILGSRADELQKASTSLLQYRESLHDKIKEMKLQDKFTKLFKKSKKGLNDKLKKVEKLVDDITDEVKDLLLK